MGWEDVWVWRTGRVLRVSLKWYGWTRLDAANQHSGNLDLPPYLPFLGKTQLQILSFVTSLILLTAHSFTSWAVTERVLLRDDRPHTQNSLLGNLKAIWDNVWTLPPGIRSVCFIQFWNL